MTPVDRDWAGCYVVWGAVGISEGIFSIRCLLVRTADKDRGMGFTPFAAEIEIDQEHEQIDSETQKVSDDQAYPSIGFRAEPK